MNRPERILVATGNAGKLREFRDLLGPAGVQVVAPAEAGWTADVVEDGETLEANALKKARAAASATGLAALADDTGLFVDALDGRPGIHSARYAGEAQDPVANCARLLSVLEDVPIGARGAAFRCVVALVIPGGGEQVFTGEVRGRITTERRGTSGFGYDPLFEVVERGRTFAEMAAEEKHGLSHRGRALRALLEFLEGLPEARHS